MSTKEKIENFEDLEVWKLSHKLKLKAYDFVKYLPNDEKYNRIQQIKRAVSSISANIAEGYGRYHYQENIQFCRQARGSLEETRDHVITARDLDQAPIDKCKEIEDLCVDVRKLLNGYIRYLQEAKNS